MRIVQHSQNNEQIELCVHWIGFKQPTWEGFRSFVKDASMKAERFMTKPFKQYNKLVQMRHKLQSQIRAQSRQLARLKDSAKSLNQTVSSDFVANQLSDGPASDN